MFINNTSKTAGVESGYVDVGYQVNVWGTGVANAPEGQAASLREGNPSHPR